MTGFTPLRDWPDALLRALQREPAIVRVVLATVRGSAPREQGAGMLVGRSEFAGTIGGGQLEWEALAAARALIDERAVPARLQRFVLAADLGQCCGGVVELWLERFVRADAGFVQALRDAAGHRVAAVLMSTMSGAELHRQIVRAPGAGGPADFLLRAPRAQAASRAIHAPTGDITLLERLDQELPPIWLYGAGHVGQALARILADLPVSLTWIDGREALIPADRRDRDWLARGADPVASVSGAPAGARFVVLTHSHALDYALCRAILSRGDFAWAGLIGSSSKAARFRSRLAREKFSDASIARLVCPIGIDGIASKWPAAIAVGIAAQLLRDLSLSGEGAVEAKEAPAAAPAARCNERDCAGCGS
ncbi:MAG TPA: xanthine dehydrogenase accessory protein XdhC [Steroidobacteraceae bacterium]|nr:xanthine dehydrogenase accessory protein XdhC [Steroidobacteraceae bacterium]